MKLYSLTSSERGKPVRKGGNKFICTSFAIGDAINNQEVARVMIDEHGFIYIIDSTGKKAVFMVQNLKLVDVTGKK